MTYGNRAAQRLARLWQRSRQRSTPSAFMALSLIALLAMGLCGPAAHAQNYTVQTLYSFTGGASNGNSPQAGLVAVNGILYGTTNLGGSANDGTIFSFNPATKTETTLYQFTGTGGDGANPRATLLNINGILYGSTLYGGTNNHGTLFSFNPATKTETMLHIFNGGDGDGPQCLLLNVGGKLYGVTPEGGSGNYGTVFSINPDGTGFQSLYGFTFDGLHGSNPVADLIDVNGIFYGNTFFDGGSANDGAVFSFDPATNAVKTLAGFSASSTGAHPGFALTDVDGILYGTTTGANGEGNGTIYSLHPDGSSFQTVHTFAGGTRDGANPFASFILIEGKLYETTTNGGSSSDGTIFSFNPATKAETVVYSFLGQAEGDGASPLGAMIEMNGILYGTTQLGGSANDGTIFALKITDTAPVTHNDTGKGYYNTPLVIPAPGILGNDSDGGKGPITASLVTQPTHGTLSSFKSDGSFTYVPNTGYLGPDAFTYTAANSIGTSSAATVTLTIQPRTPTAKDDSNLATYNTPLTIAAPGVLHNDDNGGSTPLTATLVTGTAHGTVTLSSNGGYKYTPNTGYVGTDSFTYQAANPVGKGNTATVTVVVQPTAPTANNDAGRCQHNTTLTITAPGVLGNDSTGGKPTTASLVTNPTHGTITFHSDGSFVYKPTTGFIGTDSFTYKDTNSVGTSNTATCTLTVQ